VTSASPCAKLAPGNFRGQCDRRARGEKSGPVTKLRHPRRRLLQVAKSAPTWNSARAVSDALSSPARAGTNIPIALPLSLLGGQ
jgi:hypothetical protein